MFKGLLHDTPSASKASFRFMEDKHVMCKQRARSLRSNWEKDQRGLNFGTFSSLELCKQTPGAGSTCRVLQNIFLGLSATTHRCGGEDQGVLGEKHSIERCSIGCTGKVSR